MYLLGSIKVKISSKYVLGPLNSDLCTNIEHHFLVKSSIHYFDVKWPTQLCGLLGILGRTLHLKKCIRKIR